MSSGDTVGNRWFILVGALMLQLCLGAVYAWSVFAAELETDSALGGFGWSVTETQIVFSAALATFALVMVVAGRWQDKLGPRKVALVGAVVLGLGYILSSFNPGNFLWLVLTLGIIAGAGIGIGYVCPIAAIGKWFPDKLGLATGIAVAGFGAGAFFISVLSGTGIDMPGLKIDLIQLLYNYGLAGTLLIWGVVFVAFGGFGALLLKNPPAGWKPAGWEPTVKARSTQVPGDWERADMLKTPQFWMLLVMFIFAASAGLMTIGILKLYGIDSGLPAAAAGTAVGILALFNGAGRIFWGWTSDKIGRTIAMGIMFFLQASMMFALIVLRLGSTEAGLTLAAAWIGLMFGGNFALFPAATREFFGIRNYGGNYAMVFLGYGLAGILGPIVAGQAKDVLGSFDIAFIVCGVLCILAAGLAFITKPPQYSS
ncbi:MAG TPA: MFS transporter [Methanomicrobia archaeon]|nr:MFS transporter [Methanomicrobia archaeon]